MKKRYKRNYPYENGEYATIFITSPGGVKQNYKTSIDISELVI